MTRFEMTQELEEIRARIEILSAREAFLATRLARAEAADSDHLPRPGWPIERQPQSSGRRISTSASSRIAV